LGKGVFAMGNLEKGTFWLVISNTVFFITGYAIYFVLGRFLLTPEQFGTYGLVIALFSTVNMIMVNAIQQAVTKFVSERTELAEAIKRKTIKLQFGVSTLLFIAYFLAAPFFASVFNDLSLTGLIQFSGIIFFSHPIYSIFSGCLNGLQKFRRLAGLQISYSLAKMLLIIGLVFFGFSVFGAVVGFIAASFFTVVLGTFLVGFRKPKGIFDSKNLAAFAMPLLAFAVIQNLLFNVDLFAVKALASGAGLAGYYVAAQSIARLPLIVVIAITFVLFPLVSGTTFRKQSDKTRFYISNAMRYSLLFLVPVTGLIAANSQEIVSLVYSSKYLPADQALFILSFGTMFYALFLILTTAISSSGNPKMSTAFGLAALISLFGLSFWLVPTHSIQGAALASSGAAFLAFLLSAAYVLLKFRVFLPPKSLARILIAGLLAFAFSTKLGLTGLFLLGELFLMVLLYAATLVVLGELNKRDWSLFYNMVR
jgi:stage V sporulation protein B